MRPIVTEKRANDIILAIPEVAPAEWCEDNRRRQEGFKATIKSGDHIAIIAMIKSIIEFGKRRLAVGKKNYLVDENVMKKAQKLLASEFSLSIGDDEAELMQHIEEQLTAHSAAAQ
jgi:RNA polymerase-interacting CarD/CdnL/TRCF family regulator